MTVRTHNIDHEYITGIINNPNQIDDLSNAEKFIIQKLLLANTPIDKIEKEAYNIKENESYKALNSTCQNNCPPETSSIMSAATISPPRIGFESFPNPFIINGKLNALIVVGDSYRHGARDKCAHAIDSLMVSHFVISQGVTFASNHFAKFDTWVNENELSKNHIILIGGPFVNQYIEMVNSDEKLYVFYDDSLDLIRSQVSGKKYDSRHYGAIQIIRNPFSQDKLALVCLGHSGPGTIASILSFNTEYRKHLAMNNLFNNKIPAKVVRGVDMDNDQWVDGVEFVE